MSLIDRKNTLFLFTLAFILFNSQASAQESIVLVTAGFDQDGFSLIQAVKGLGNPPNYLNEKNNEYIRVDLSRRARVEKTIYLSDPRYKATEYIDIETGDISAVKAFEPNALLTLVLPGEYDSASFFDSNSTLLLTLDLHTLAKTTPTPQVVELKPEKQSDSVAYANLLVLVLLAVVSLVSITAHFLRWVK